MGVEMRVVLVVWVAMGVCAQAQPVPLPGLTGAALKAHPLIEAAEGGLRAAKGRTLQAWAPASPELYVHEEEIPTAGSFGDGGMRYYGVSQEFDLPLVTGSRAAVQRRFADAARARRDMARLEVRAAVITAWGSFYAAEHRLSILREAASVAEAFAQKAQRRVEAGEGTRLELLRASSAAASAQAALRRGERERSAAAAELASAVGRRIEGLVASGVALDPPSRIDLVAVSVEEHPLLREARCEFEGFDADRARGWMEYVPGFTAGVFRQEIPSMGMFWGAELTARVPLWFMLGERGRGEERSGLAMASSARLRALELVLRARVETAEQGVRAAEAGVAAYSDGLLREAEEALRAAAMGYEAGEIGYIEFLEAQRGAFEIMLGYHEALAAAYAAVAEYELATGVEVVK
jgi:cobalt-zinc-cadmium efflux system outer membrane protein